MGSFGGGWGGGMSLCLGAGFEDLAVGGDSGQMCPTYSKGRRDNGMPGEMGEEEQQQGRPSVISSVLCRSNHGASPARVAMRTDRMQGAGGTLNLPSLPPSTQEDTCLRPCEDLAERGPWKPGCGRRQVARCGRGLEILRGTVTRD